MLYLHIYIGVLSLFTVTLAKDRLGFPYSFDPHTLRSGRFGFMDLEYLRHTFCNSSCTSANTMPYIVNLVCAVKCPELYLPIYVSTMKQMKGSTISSIITSTERSKKTSTQSISMLPQTETSSRPIITVSQTEKPSRRTQHTMSQQTVPVTHQTHKQTTTATTTATATTSQKLP